jgi:hypothetical protein
MNYELSIMNYELSIMNYQLSIINWRGGEQGEGRIKKIRFFVTWYGSIGGHKSTKSLSGKRFN